MKVFLFLILFLCFQEAQPEIAVDVGTVEPNQVARIRVTVSNPSTAELLWDNILRIEEAHPYFVPIKEEYTLSHEIRPGQTDIGELTFQVVREAEAGEYPLTISLGGGVGSCHEGCVPYFLEKEILVKVTRNEPEISISHTGSENQIKITIKNAGSGTAQNVTCNGEVVGTVKPGETKEITIDRKSSFIIEYEDEYGKKFTEPYRISESKPDGDSAVQSGLVLVGILFGYLFKRSRN